jgi:iron complex outermembrane recepter protein
LYNNIKFRCVCEYLILCSSLCVAGSVSAEHPTSLSEIVVSGEYSGFDVYVLSPDLINAPAADSAQLLKKVPGANVNSNGTVTGIAQYRGMYGDRINILVDDIKISSGGPNAMDTPISYIPRAQLESLEVIRGIAPVSSGNETIGGTIRATSTHSNFTEEKQFSLHGEASAGVQSVNSGYDASLLMSLANQNHRMHVSGSRQDSDDYDFGDGEVTPSEHDRNSYEVGYGYKIEDHEFGLEYVRNDTNESGTPALPMDIVFIDADIVRGTYKSRWNQVDIESKVYWSQIDHKMSNFELRLPPLTGGGAGPGTMQRFSLADSEDVGYAIDASMVFAGGKLKLGADAHLSNHDADIFNPMSATFLVKNYNDIERDVFGVFGEWQRELTSAWEMELGLRYTRVNMDAGNVSATGMAGMMAANANSLATTFNNADLSQEDNNIDAVLELTYALRQDANIEIGFARKMRSASYQERYLWLPLQSTGGLADGNNYIGDINLDPEVAYQFELGLDWRNKRAYFAPRAFYHHVDDYIQGIDATNTTARAFHTMATGMTGSSAKLLQFANIDARLYGIDADFGYHLNDFWHVDGAVSYVKGERRDNGDNLYRISPVNARLGVTRQQKNWSATLETLAYLEKDDVSGVTNELETAGYALLNIYGNYNIPKSGFTLVAGIDNLLDKNYAPHLGGVNRVRGVDVPVGVRVPDPGINGYINLVYKW